MTDHGPVGDRDLERRQTLRERVRAEWIAGAEEEFWRKADREADDG